MKPDRILKIVLAIASLICVLDMPYGYYQLYRFIALGAFLYLAYTEQENNESKIEITGRTTGSLLVKLYLYNII